MLFRSYDVPRCANIGLDFPSRETTLFRGILRCMEGRDLPRFGSIRLMSIFTGAEPAHHYIQPNKFKCVRRMLSHQKGSIYPNLLLSPYGKSSSVNSHFTITKI